MKTVVLLTTLLIFISCHKEKNEQIEVLPEKKESTNKGIKLITQNTFEFLGNGKDSLTSKIISKYNKDGYISENLTYLPNGSLKLSYIYSYIQVGYISELNSKPNYAFSPNKWTYKYDSNGNEIEMVAFNGDGSISYKSTSKYDNEGKMIERSWLSSDSNSKQICTYDKNGNLIEMNEYYDGSTLSSLTTTFKYDNRGNITDTKRFNTIDSFYEYWTFEFDEKGNQISQTSYNLDGTIQSVFSFNYKDIDLKGNWLKKETIWDNRIVYLIERKIEYYN